jgi:hypothetical protein
VEPVSPAPLPRRRRAGTVDAMEATLGEALRLGLTGLRRERWLVAVGLLTTLLRRALGLPALLVALLLLVRGAWRAHELAPWSGEAPALGAGWVALQPRVLALVVGLSACAALLGWLLRVAFLAGALSTLGGAMGATAIREPRFAAGLAWGFASLLPTAVLALALEWTGQLFLAGTLFAAVRITGAAAGTGRVALAAAVAAMVVVGLLVALLTSAIADAALVRTAVRGDGPVEALAQASSRVLARPAAYLLAMLGFGLLSLVATLVVQSVSGLASGLAAQAPGLVAAGPAFMLGALALTLAAALELWWLASLTALAAREG